MRKPTILSIALIIFFSLNVDAQVEVKDIPLTPEHKKAVIAILKKADQRYYRFESGKEIYGSRKISGAESKKIKEFGAPDTKNVKIQFKESKSIVVYFKDGTILAATSPPGKTDSDVLVNLLGKEGADKLRDLLSKYFLHEVND